MSTCHVDTPQTDRSYSNARVTDTLIICKRLTTNTLSANLGILGSLDAKEIVAGEGPEAMATIEVPPLYLFLGQNGANNIPLNVANLYWDVQSIVAGVVGSTLVFTAPCDIDELALVIYSAGNNSPVGTFSIEPRDITGATAIPGTSVPADLGAAAVPAWGVARYVFTTPLQAGDKFVLLVNTSDTANNQIRLVLHGICKQ